MRLSLRLSLIFLFLLLTSNFFVVSLSNLLLPIYGQVRADQADTLRPAADREGTDWYDVPEAGNDWEKIDDTTPDEDATYLWLDRAGSNCNQGWTHSDFSTSNTLDSVRMGIRARTTAITGTSQIKFGREWYDAEGWHECPNNALTDLSTDWTTYTATWHRDSCSQGEEPFLWTASGLNNSGFAWWFSSYAVGSPPDSFGVTTANLDKKLTSNGYIALYRYQADFTDSVDMLAIYCKTVVVSSNFRLGLYTDSLGGTTHYPKYLMDTTAQFAIQQGWNRIQLVNGCKKVTNGEWYWVAFRYETNNDTLKNESATARGRYKVYAYSDGWEQTFSGGTSENADYDLQAIRSLTGQNQATQSFVVVYSHAVVGGKSGKNILSGGILK